MNGQADYSGVWKCRYWYPSNTHDGEDISEYEVIAEETGGHLIFQSVPTPAGSYIFIRLHIDGVYAAGSWTENTEPEGEFAGMIYSGVVQLLIADDGRSMTGKWVGTGRDLQQQKPGIFGGKWEFTRLPEVNE